MPLMVRRYPKRRRPPDMSDDGSGLEELCNGDLSALARAVEHIDDRQVPGHFRDRIARRTAVLRDAKARRLATGLVGTDLSAAELDAIMPTRED